jgi:Tol biopolymer transport system component
MIELKNVERSYKTGPTNAWFLCGIESPRRWPQRSLLAVVAFILAACLPVAQCFAANPNGKTKKAAPAPLAPGAYFGLKPPGKTPEIFALGIISQTNRLVDHIAFSPDGSECVFTVWGPNYSSAKIFWTKRAGDAWTPQVEAPFSVGHYAMSASFSMDGNRLYFSYGGHGSSDLWMVQRTAQGWSDPTRLASPINSAGQNSSYSETADGIVYFSSNRPGSQGADHLDDIWRTRRVPGQPLQVEDLGATVNSTAADFDPFIARDGSYLIFTSERPGSIGGSDLYVSFPNGNGGWTAPLNLNKYCPGINIAGSQTVGPSVSPDGRYLFFTRYTKTATGEQEDIYWVENPVSGPALREVPAPK